LAAACFAVSAGCDQPLAPSPEALQLACPAAVGVETDVLSPLPIQFGAPVPSGGTPPYQTSCAPGSGTLFAPGPTTVRCQVNDSRAEAASCTFLVSVTVPAKLSKTRFTAFGDSITEGVTSPAPMRLLALHPLAAYPGELQTTLAARYPRQQFIVFNRGLGGERLSRGEERLPGVLDADRPEVLLLLEGVNNIRNEPRAELFADMASMVDAARSRNIEVILAKLLPISAEREAGRPGTIAAIQALNAEIDRIAAARGLGPPVDLYGLFLANPQWLGMDGLHPTAEGYVHIADAWFDAIVGRYHMAGTEQ
jgi:lysophospholipase L1-like esterase